MLLAATRRRRMHENQDDEVKIENIDEPDNKTDNQEESFESEQVE